jgi:hypothetical protein
VDKPTNLVFIRPTKVAGSSITEALTILRLRRLDIIEGYFFQKGWVVFDHLHYPSLVEKGYVSKQFDNTSFKFAFVRDPYDRAVSLFFHELKWRHAQYHSFLEFCRTLTLGFEPVGLYSNLGNSIWNPQVRWIDGINLDFMGRFETLENDFSALCNRLNINTPALPRRTTTKHDHFSTYYCDESIAIINQVYEDDFQRFNYPMKGQA